MGTGLSYAEVGATCVGEVEWVVPVGWRGFERVVRIGHGDAEWEAAVEAVMRWGVKTRSGFEVRPEGIVREGVDYTLVARASGLREPVRVVAVVEREDRQGFAYGTRIGHPVSGEEAFVVHRTPDGVVWLTLRSLTRPGRGVWRLVYPAILIAQRWYRRRYLTALDA